MWTVYLISILFNLIQNRTVYVFNHGPCRVVSISVDSPFGTKSEYRYDEANRLVQISTVHDSGQISFKTYYHTEDSLEIISSNSDASYTTISKYAINSQGFAEGGISITYQSAAGKVRVASKPTSEFYEYSKDGYLTSFEKINRDGSVSVTKYIYENGNLISGQSEENEIHYGYYLDKSSSSRDEKTLFGNKSYNLLESIEYMEKIPRGISTGNRHELYRYDFDSSGRIKKKYTTVLMDKSEQQFVTSYEWECL